MRFYRSLTSDALLYSLYCAVSDLVEIKTSFHDRCSRHLLPLRRTYAPWYFVLTQAIQGNDKVSHHFPHSTISTLTVPSTRTSTRTSIEPLEPVNPEISQSRSTVQLPLRTGTRPGPSIISVVKLSPSLDFGLMSLHTVPSYPCCWRHCIPSWSRQVRFPNAVHAPVVRGWHVTGC